MGNDHHDHLKEDSHPSLRVLDSLADGMFDFMTKNFRKMPKPVQILVYLIIVACFFGAFSKIIFPEWFSPEIEIMGVIALAGGRSIPDSISTVELEGERMFVKKTDEEDYFVYEWIVKAPKYALAEEQRFNLARLEDEKGNEKGYRVFPHQRFSRRIERCLTFLTALLPPQRLRLDSA